MLRVFLRRIRVGLLNRRRKRKKHKRKKTTQKQKEIEKTYKVDGGPGSKRNTLSSVKKTSKNFF